MKKDYDLEEAFAAIEDELINSMMRNMKRHTLEEVSEDKEWEMWQALQLKSLEQYKQKNKSDFEKWFSSINDQIGELIKEANQNGQMEQEIKILEAIRNGFRGYKRASNTMQAEFFKLNERKLEALIKATTDDLKKAEHAILRRANDQYRKAIFNAQVYANIGAGTYEKAVDMATKDMLSAGLNCVEYANGARHTLKDYADMAIRTASKRAYLQGEGVMRQAWGISTVIMNKRGNPCPKCLPFCGKVLIDDVWSGGSADDGPYPLMSSAIAAGLYHPRCKDSHTTYFEGVSTPPDDRYTKEEIQQIEDDYRLEQKRIYAKKQAEKYTRLAKNSIDTDNQRKYQRLADKWKSRAHDWNLSKFTEILQDYNAGQKDVISHWSIQKNLNKSKIGKETIEYIVQHPELDIQICYDIDHAPGVDGEQLGNTIRVYASDTKTIQRTAEVLIHEVTHHRYNIGGSQWAECVCKAQEIKHKVNRDKLTGSEIRDIIKETKALYPEFSWR